MVSLCSSIVAPFLSGHLIIEPLTFEQFKTALGFVTKNYCGHPVTRESLQQLRPSLPKFYADDAIWHSKGIAIACRPIGGKRDNKADTQFDKDCFEYCAFVFSENRPDYNLHNDIHSQLKNFIAAL